MMNVSCWTCLLCAIMVLSLHAAAAFMAPKSLIGGPFQTSFLPIIHQHQQQHHSSKSKQLVRMALAPNGDADDDDDDKHESSPGQLRRRRDRIKNWMKSSGTSWGRSTASSSSSNNSPMVRPIRMKDGSIVEDDNDNDSSSRLKPNFGHLFSGMPSMDDILSGGAGGAEEDTDDNRPAASKTPPQDDSWFDGERKQIETNYQEILQKMISQLEEQRQGGGDNPDSGGSVPTNAEAMIKDVLRQEMKMEIDATREARAQENWDRLASTKIKAVEAQNVKGVSNNVVDHLLKKDKDAQDVTDAAQARVDDYRRYELEAFLKKPNQEGASDPPLPANTGDLDQWALERLQDMVDSRAEADDDDDVDDFIVTDIIEENLEDLRERMELEAERSSIRPETMKEWQMYRAISSRLGMQNGNDNEDGSTNTNANQRNSDEAEEQIAAQLESWKGYLAKEDVIRVKSGLARGPKLPFEWQESGRDLEIAEAQIKEAIANQGAAGQKLKTKVEIRKDLNRKSLAAMEQLVLTSDPVRSARLQKDLDILRQELESNDYLDIDEALLEEQGEELSGPVDISGVFTQEAQTESSQATTVQLNSGGGGGKPPSPSTPFFDEPIDTEGAAPSGTPFFADNDESNMETKPSPPATAFFSDNDDAVTEPPATPFLSSEEEKQGGDSEGSGYSLGTIDEQKLRLMYQRAGARTEEEKAVIRAQWEDFQQFEKSKRDGSGLTDGDDSALISRAKIKYDISEVTKDDGDFDAEKILASIGPRPSRKRKPEGTQSPESASDEATGTSSSLDPAEVSDSLYRAVSAVGGGRTKDDPEAKAKEQAAFSEFTEKENEMRQSLDDLDEEIAGDVLSSAGEDFDESKYAEDALASLADRPKPKRRKLSETEYSDRGIALSDSDDDNDDEDDVESVTEDSAVIDKMASEDSLMPGWVRKEREKSSDGRGGFLGSDIDEVFDDDVYEHNQRQLAEYERRRAGGKKQMGIDISDVIGRGSEDYADYNFDDNYRSGKSTGWGTSGFEARKANLLEYTELEVAELNALMDHKDSVHSTGVSQYLPRINKPFKEFGAIFRLEGVLLDTTGFQYKAWSKVASEKGFKSPSLEDVRRAAVLRPDVAVRSAFFWTDDIQLCREAASAHKDALQDVFGEWMEESSIVPPKIEPAEESDRGSLSIGEENKEENPMQPAVDPLAGVPEAERIKLLVDAWSRTAVTHRLVAPSREQVELSSVLGPEIAVKSSFRWTEDEAEIDKYVTTFRRIMKDLVGGSEPEELPSGAAPETPAPSKILDENTMMELQFKAWTKLAEENGFELPLPAEVMAAVVINDPTIAIRDGFGWTDDSSRIPTLVASYEGSLADFVSDWRGEPRAQVASAPAPEPQAEVQQAVAESSSGPTQEEILQMQDHAWKSAALNHGFQRPLTDQLQLAMKMTPNEAITRLFGWTSDEELIRAVCLTFESALKDISQKYIRKYNLPAHVSLFPRQPATATQPQQASSGTEDVFQVALDAWNAVAKKNGFEMPDEEQILFALSVGAEDAIISGFEWASDPEEVKRIIDGYRDELRVWQSKRPHQSTRLQTVEHTGDALPMFSVIPGAEHWLKSLLDVEIQCAVMSYFSREQLAVLLEVSGLTHLFGPDKRVTASDNYGREVDQLLGAALRVERRPDHCVVFDSSPHASVAAHDVEMRSVGVIGAFPRYDLLSADSTASSFEELTAMNVRRLFAERVYDQPMVEMQAADPERRTRAKTKFYWEGDD